MVSKRGNIQHIEINVSNFQKSKAFYQDFLEWLGYKRILDETDFDGWDNGEAKIFVTYLERYKELGFHRFFFQAEDGIRDVAVTGVQTCALPIFVRGARGGGGRGERDGPAQRGGGTMSRAENGSVRAGGRVQYVLDRARGAGGRQHRCARDCRVPEAAGGRRRTLDPGGHRRQRPRGGRRRRRGQGRAPRTVARRRARPRLRRLGAQPWRPGRTRAGSARP